MSTEETSEEREANNETNQEQGSRGSWLMGSQKLCQGGTDNFPA